MKCKKEFVRGIKKTKEHSKTAAEWELGSECRRSKRLCSVHSAVKFGTGIFNGAQSVDKMLLRVADRELEM